MKNVREFKRGETIYVAVAKDNGIEYEKRIFLTSIQGAWYPYICVALDYEDDYQSGRPFEVMTWFDLKEIEGEKTIVLPQLHFSGHSNDV